MNFNYKFWIALVLSVILGVIIAWIDSSPNWDDTAVIVVIVFCISALFAFVMKKRPWIYALTIGIWIPLWNIISTHNYSSLLSLCVSFLGAYIGYAFKKLLLM